MAKMPTIRLKKTELPLDASVARGRAIDVKDSYSQQLLQLLNEIHTSETNKHLDGSVRFRAHFSSAVLRFDGAGPVRLQPAFHPLINRRLLDSGSHNAPWIWKAAASLGGTRDFIARQTPAETILGPHEATAYQFFIPFEEKFFVDGVHKDERAAMTDRFIESKEMRSLRRYLSRINFDCIKAGLPVQFQVGPSHGRVFWTETCWEGPHKFCPSAAVSVSFNRVWLQHKSYAAISRLNNLSSELVPAEFDLDRVRQAMTGKGEASLRHLPVRLDVAYQVVTHGGLPKTFSTAWTKELIFGVTPKPEDVRSGAAPIPPKAEIVSLTTLLEKLPEMKRIVRTLMRIARPYDTASFLPTDL